MASSWQTEGVDVKLVDGHLELPSTYRRVVEEPWAVDLDVVVLEQDLQELELELHLLGLDAIPERLYEVQRQQKEGKVSKSNTCSPSLQGLLLYG